MCVCSTTTGNHKISTSSFSSSHIFLFCLHCPIDTFPRTLSANLPRLLAIQPENVGYRPSQVLPLLFARVLPSKSTMMEELKYSTLVDSAEAILMCCGYPTTTLHWYFMAAMRAQSCVSPAMAGSRNGSISFSEPKLAPAEAVSYISQPVRLQFDTQPKRSFAEGLECRAAIQRQWTFPSRLWAW